MKLFLASLASQTLDLVLPLLPDKPNKLKVAYIGTAMDPYLTGEHFPWMVEGRKKLVEMGFVVTDYDLKGKTASNFHDELSEFDAIFVDGGNSFYLLQEMQKSGFTKIIRELLNKGLIYMGSSAGACVVGSSLSHLISVDHPELAPELKDFTGLNLVDVNLIPHFGRDKYVTRHTQIKKDFGDKVTFLRDDQVLIVNNDKITLVANS